VRQSDIADIAAIADIAEVVSVAEPALARGTALGRFVILGLVGRGAMGEVYGAYDPDLDRKIAIKLVRARVDRTDDTADGRTRLMREAQATAKISHPNVVVVYDAGTFGERVFIAMEFVEGHTLRYWLQARERSWGEVLEAFLAAGRGLAAAHDKELVHRDFKPDNVMVAVGGQVRVMDFGLARIAVAGALPPPPAAKAGEGARGAAAAAERSFEATQELDVTQNLATPRAPDPPATALFQENITATGAVLGTPAYMSPEQFQRQPADARSDQFSFCVALYEALYGRRPFSGRTLDELADNVVAGRLAAQQPAPRVPAWVRQALERGLRVNPDERFPSMNALLAELERRPGPGRRGFAEGAAAKLAGVWEAPAGGQPVETPEKATMRAAFLATGKAYAAASFAGASTVLDRFAQRWSDLYVEVLEATHVRGEQSAEILDLRMASLGESLDDLKALCRLFRAATAEVVENAVNAANALGTLERVQDVKLLRAVVRPPEDAATREAVDELRARLVELRAMWRVGRVAEGLEAAGPLVDDARRIGYGPMLAEILFVYGTLQHDAAKMRVVAATLEDAIWTAEAGRHDEVAAAAASHLMYITGYYEARFDVAEIWSRYTEAILRRMGTGHDQLWGWFLNNRAVMREQQGRLTEAIADTLQAVAIKERALGPEAPDLAASIGNLANHYAVQADFDQALEASARAVAIMHASIGPDHPRMAIVLSNHGQLLYRVRRFDEALDVARRTLAVFERETDPNGMFVTFSLRTIGLCELARGRHGEAVRALERAVAIREVIEKRPLRLAEVHFALARALHEGGGAPARGLALARRARDEYAQAVPTGVVLRDLAELDAWLAARAAA
jgi:tRNA A-37 threonylcarbamoyl transferase component Bud32/tetratricopeptide (TPR) repeat protein